MKVTTAKRLVILMFGLSYFSLADPSTQHKEVLGIEITETKDKELAEKLIKSFIGEVLLKRELKMAGGYFCSEIQYQGHDRNISIPDDTLKMNYSHDRDLFLDDCSKLLDMMPKVNPEHIRLIKLQELGKNPISNLSEAKVYKAEFAYGEGIGSFAIIFPSISTKEEDAKFSSRFWDVFRLLR